MGLGLRFFLLLVSISLLFVFGTLIFTRGFLLNRTTLNETSSCVVDFTIQSDKHGEEGCWMHRRFSKAVVVVIDALRYDFMLYNHSLSDETASYFENKLPLLEELLRDKPQQSRLYKFVADPPTTTLQRLKGLTTGSLPTFVDAGSNFASYEITEDNIIDQLLKINKRLTFMGDDTWLGLFPDRFLISFPFPSFNVMDLHTVDNGVIEHLIPEMKKTEWDVMIAHFLGVDHCGHRFGPNHPEMSSKLKQMDSVLRSIVKQMADDTILLVMGDHGMTRTGDHGGDSQNELEAGLFVYSPAQITSTPLPKDPSLYKTVSQIDLVPTLSLLLGAPIPFSNLGMVMTDFFNHCPWWKTGNSKVKQTYHSLKSLRLNAYQVNGYLEAYKRVSGDLDNERVSELQKLFLHSESDLQNLLTAMVKDNDNRNIEQRMEILEDHYVTYLTGVKSLCQNTWAKFDMASVYLGLALVFLSICCTVTVFVLSRSIQETTSWRIYACVICTFVLTVFAAVQKSYISQLYQSSMTVILGTLDVLVFVVISIAIWNMSKTKKDEKTGSSENKPDKFKMPTLDTLLACIICILTFASYFSNSYVVNEDASVAFLAQTIIAVLGYMVISDFFHREHLAELAKREKGGPYKRSHHFDVIKMLTHPCCITLGVVVVMLACVRASTIFKAYREEHINSEISVFLEPLSEVTFKNARYVFSVICLAATVVASRFWMRHFGNFNGTSFSVICGRYAIPTLAVCLALHWALKGLPAKVLDSMEPWQQIALPQFAYILVAICLIAITARPLCIYILPNQDNQEVPFYPGLSRNQMISSLFSHVKHNWKRSLANAQSGDQPPIVYGLGTVYSACVVFLVTVTSLLISLLLGDGISPSVFLMLLVQFLYLELCAALYGSESSGNKSFPVLPVIGWAVLSSTFFYNTGHQATVTTIRWEAAFTGVHGNHNNNILPAVLVGLNTFGSYVLFIVASPLLLFSQRICAGLLTVFSKVKSQSAEKGDFSFHEEPTQLRCRLFRLFLATILFQSLKLFGSMCAAALHRRHLMVWKIFAPRFVFEVIISLVVFALCTLMYLFVLRVDAALYKWVTRLEESQKSK